jgi:hypothetical protein
MHTRAVQLLNTLVAFGQSLETSWPWTRSPASTVR